MEEIEFVKEPRCRMRDCFANKKGLCTILTDNHFNRVCPFYKREREGKTWNT